VAEAAEEQHHEPNELAGRLPRDLLLVMACVVALVDLYVTDERRRPPSG
jgi:hypothetical protein